MNQLHKQTKLSIKPSGKPAPQQQAETSINSLSIWLFICGALTSLDIRLIGRVTIAEILVFASIPVLFLTRKVIFWNGNFLRCMGLLAAMFLATIVADHYNGFILELSARAFARPVFIFGFLVFFVLVLERAPRSLVWFIYGLVIAGVINYFRPSEFEKEGMEDASTYGGIVFRIEPLIYAVAVAVATWAWLKTRLAAVGIVLVSITALIILGSSRSSLLTYLMALFTMTALIAINPSGRRRFTLTKNRLLGLSLSGIAALSLFYFAYISLAPSGILGEDQRNKFEQQSTTTLGTSPLGFVLGGRPQVYGAILGIKDRPILGFGSWRHDLTSGYVVDAFTDVGSDPRVIDLMNKTGIAPGAGHSVLFQAWVENGIIPAICWTLIAGSMLSVFLFNIRNNTIYTAFFILSFTAFAWTFFFSPPPTWLRYLVGLYLAYYTVFMDKNRPLRNPIDLS